MEFSSTVTRAPTSVGIPPGEQEQTRTMMAGSWFWVRKARPALLCLLNATHGGRAPCHPPRRKLQSQFFLRGDIETSALTLKNFTNLSTGNLPSWYHLIIL